MMSLDPDQISVLSPQKTPLCNYTLQFPSLLVFHCPRKGCYSFVSCREG